MPSDISYANFVVMWFFFFIMMYNMYIFALKLLIEMLICCIFVNFGRKIFFQNIQSSLDLIFQHKHTL